MAHIVQVTEIPRKASMKVLLLNLVQSRAEKLALISAQEVITVAARLAEFINQSKSIYEHKARRFALDMAFEYLDNHSSLMNPLDFEKIVNDNYAFLVINEDQEDEIPTYDNDVELRKKALDILVLMKIGSLEYAPKIEHYLKTGKIPN